jgi:hypothetical protein
LDFETGTRIPLLPKLPIRAIRAIRGQFPRQIREMRARILNNQGTTARRI